MTIKLLDQKTVQKIAAGEVVDRPSSIVKEMVENSIDAGARNIDVEYFKGGMEKIIISDDGTGIPSNQIELAFKRHATSKIKNFNDIYEIYTMGFRGEALASIASVAEIEISTKSKDEQVGKKIIFQNGKKTYESLIAMNTGTSIEVRSLFDNIPVRKKFLKSTLSESNSINNLMYKLALGNPDISISLTKDDKEIFQTLSQADLKYNINEILGNNIANSLIELEGRNEDYIFYGLVSDNTYFRGNRSFQFIYVNNRYVESPEIRDNIERAYKQIIPNGKFPLYLIYIQTNPKNIDVNIHPNKTKINFTNLDNFTNLVNSKVKLSLRPKAIKVEKDAKDKNSEQILFIEQEDKFKDLIEKYKDDVGHLNQNKLTDINLSYNRDPSELFINSEVKDLFVEESSFDLDYDNNVSNGSSLKYDTEEFLVEENINSFADRSEKESLDLDFNNLNYIGGIFKTYLIFEYKNDEVIILDQHAAHERINYEKLLNDFTNSRMDSQLLLTPIRIDLIEEDFKSYEKHKIDFNNLGFEIEMFSESSILLREVPNLGDISYRNLFLDILDNSRNNELTSSELLDLLIQKACKLSVRAGDNLSKEEVTSILLDLSKCKYPFTCPHGRPVFITIDKISLEKEFLRVK